MKVCGIDCPPRLFLSLIKPLNNLLHFTLIYFLTKHKLTEESNFALLRDQNLPIST